MKKKLSILLIILSSMSALILTFYLISERYHEEPVYAHEIHCDGNDGGYRINCSTDYYTINFVQRPALFSLGDIELIAFWLFSLIVNAIAIMYIILTNFGRNVNNPIESLNKENELLKIQFENSELKKRLNDL